MAIGIRIHLEASGTGGTLGGAIGLADKTVLGLAFMLYASTIEKDIATCT